MLVLWYETQPFAARIVLCGVSRCPADAPTQLRKIIVDNADEKAATAAA
jgi:hypothetical protein